MLNKQCDVVLITQLYASILGGKSSADNLVLLGILRSEMIKAAGDVERAAAILERAYIGTANGSREEKAALLAYGTLAKVASSVGHTRLAEHIADTFYCCAHEGTTEEKEALDIYWGILEDAKKNEDWVVALRIAKNASMRLPWNSPERRSAMTVVAEILKSTAQLGTISDIFSKMGSGLMCTRRPQGAIGGAEQSLGII